MADIRNISLTKKAQSADISNASVTTTVNFPSIVANIPDVATFGVVIETDTRINVDLSGYGEEAIPQPELIKYAQDLVLQIERFLVLLNKSLLEIALLSDINSKVVGKDIQETATMSEFFQTVAIFNRNFFDFPIILETYSNGINKPFTDSSTATDDFLKTFNKNVIETSITSEVVSQIISIVKLETGIATDVFSNLFEKPFTDSSIASDLFTNLIGKNVIEIITTDEIISSIFGKNLQDLIVTTDDVLGVANIDDDQTAFVEKVVRDFADISELFTTVTEFLRSFQDIPLASEILNVDVASIKFDIGNITDSISLSPQIVFSDQLSQQAYSIAYYSIPGYFEQDGLGDIATLLLNKGVVDTTILSDIIDLLATFDRVFLDVPVIADIIDKSFEKQLSDAVANVDSARLALDKALLDITSIGLDVISFESNKEVVDISLVTDLVDLLVNKTVVDIPLVSEILSAIVDIIKSDISSATDVISTLIDFNRAFTDDASIADVPSFETNLEKTDTAVSTDTTSFTPNKVVVETGVITEIVSNDVSTTYSDNSIALDTASKSILPSILDTSTTVDLLSQEVSKLLVDLPIISDIVNNDIDIVRTDNSTATDVIVFSSGFERYPEDSVALSETYEFNFEVSKIDTVITTDDVLGVANIDDDQIAFVEKVLRDFPLIIDTIETIVTFDRSINETSIIAELQNISIDKQVLDNGLITDIFSNLLQTIYSEASIASDSSSIALSKPVTEDNIISSDYFLKTFNKIPIETVVMSDSGSTNKQSYFSSTFAIPGYSGTNTTF